MGKPRERAEKRAANEDEEKPPVGGRHRNVFGDVSNSRRRKLSDGRAKVAIEDLPREQPSRRRSARLSAKATDGSALLEKAKDTRISRRKVLDGAHQVFAKLNAEPQQLPTVQSTIAKKTLRNSNHALAERQSVGTKSTLQLRISNTARTAQNPNYLSEANYSMVRAPLDPSKYVQGIAHHDFIRRFDVLEATDYVTDIYQRLFNVEPDFQVSPCMENQPELSSSMRSILVDWLVEVHTKFRLIPETLYLCVNIIDRYLSQVETVRKRLQLVGITAMLIASKYEEIYPPEIRDCVCITDNAYSRQDILAMEASILRILEFKISAPTAYPFCNRYLQILDIVSPTIKAAACYYLERTLQESEFLPFRPSLVAAAAVCLALNHPATRIDGHAARVFPVHQDLQQYTGFSASLIFKVACCIADKLSKEMSTATRRPLVAVKRKYQTSEFLKVANLIPPYDIGLVEMIFGMNEDDVE